MTDPQSPALRAPFAPSLLARVAALGALLAPTALAELDTPPVPPPAPSGAVQLADLVPEDVFAFVQFSGTAQAAQLAQSLELMELWREPEMQAFVENLVYEVREEIQRAPRQDREQIAMARELLSGRFGLAVGELHLSWIDGQPMPLPGAVAALELSPGQRDQVGGLIAQALGALGDEIATSKHLLAGQEITYLSPRDGEFNVTVGYCLTDDMLLVGFEEALLEHCVKQLKAPGAEGTLAASEALRASRKHAAGELVLESFLNVEAFKQRVGGLIPIEVNRALETLGLDAIEGVYYGTSIHQGGGWDTLAVHAPGPRTGLLACGGGQPFSQSTFAMVPDEAVLVSAVRFDGGQAFETILDAMGHVVPPVAFEEFDRGLARAESQLGFNPIDDLLNTLGSELVGFVELPRNGVIPSGTVALSLDDAERFNSTLQRLLTESRAPVKRVDYRGTLLHVIDAEDLPIAPSFAISNGRLILSTTPGALKRTLAGLDAQTDSAVVARLGNLPWEDVAYVSYLDVPRLAAFGHNFAENLLPAAIDEAGLPLDAYQFPSLETFTAHLAPVIEVGYETESGWVVNDSPMGLAAWVALASHGLNSLPLSGPGNAQADSRQPASLVAAERAQAPKAKPASDSAPDGVVNPVEAGSLEELALVKRLRELDEALADNPDNAGLHFQRAVTLGQVREFEKALEAYDAAEEHGFGQTGTLHYNRACTYSLMGETESSLEALGKAFDAGFKNWEFIQRDSDLKHVRQDARFDPLVDAYRKGL
ncbi:MAG: TPR end-of-group domain-containing protein [Planctomycetota bacterium]